RVGGVDRRGAIEGIEHVVGRIEIFVIGNCFDLEESIRRLRLRAAPLEFGVMFEGGFVARHAISVRMLIWRCNRLPCRNLCDAGFRCLEGLFVFFLFSLQATLTDPWVVPILPTNRATRAAE